MAHRTLHADLTANNAVSGTLGMLMTGAYRLNNMAK
jgi:hypothetical protein